jgi:DNA-binding GntR family transcriptional regulator
MSTSSPNKISSRVNVSGVGHTSLYSDLRERIINLELPPGTILSRDELAKHYGVSQTPVRDALIRLADNDLVAIHPQSKTLVAKIDTQKLESIHFLRVSVEVEVAQTLAKNPDADALRQAHSILKLQSALIEADPDMGMFSDLDRQFHQSLFSAAGVEDLFDILTTKLGNLYRCQRLELPRSGKMQDIVSAHSAILEGITDGNPDRAADAVRKHLSGTISRISAIQKDHPEYFQPKSA